MVNIMDEQVINDLMVLIDVAKRYEEWEYLNDKQKKQWIRNFCIENMKNE